MRFGKTIIALVFVSVACLAQEPYHNSLAWRQQQRLASVSSLIFPYTNKLAYTFSFVDVLTNAAVSTWIDEIQGLPANYVGVRPTNTDDGLQFWNSARLTNAALLVTSNSSFGYYIRVTNHTSTIGCIWFYSVASAFGHGVRGNFGLGTGTFSYNSIDVAPLVSNAWTSIIFTEVPTTTNYAIMCFTNGVLSYSNNFTSVSPPWTMNNMGDDTFGGSFKGQIKEMRVWTNVGYWTPTDSMNYHRYCTNRFGQ